MKNKFGNINYINLTLHSEMKNIKQTYRQFFELNFEFDCESLHVDLLQCKLSDL